MKRRHMLGLTIAVALGIWLSSIFIPKNPATLTRDLASVLMVLRDNHVTAYDDQDWCRNMVVAQKIYADPPTDPSVACLTNRESSVSFDKKSRGIFEKVRNATKAAGLDIMAIDVEYRDDGAIEYAELSERQLFGRDAYIYRPDDAPPEIPKGRVTRVGTGWFHYQGD